MRAERDAGPATSLNSCCRARSLAARTRSWRLASCCPPTCPGMINLAQGEYVAVGGLVLATLAPLGVPLPLCLAAVSAAGLLLGAVQERLTVRADPASAPLHPDYGDTRGGGRDPRRGLSDLRQRSARRARLQRRRRVLHLAGRYCRCRRCGMGVARRCWWRAYSASLSFTLLGRAIRACSINPRAARLMGINPRR